MYTDGAKRKPIDRDHTHNQLMSAAAVGGRRVSAIAMAAGKATPFLPWTKIMLLISAYMIVLSRAAWASRPGRPEANLCQIDESEYIDDQGETVKEYYECPGPDDPPENNLCCGEQKCCSSVQVNRVSC